MQVSCVENYDKRNRLPVAQRVVGIGVVAVEVIAAVVYSV